MSKITDDMVVEAVGLPSRKRYNKFVAMSTEEMKRGGDLAKAETWARLALAEATLLVAER